MKNLRSFNVRFKGTIETCFNADEVKIDEDSLTFYVDSNMVFYASLVDIVYVKEFKVDNNLGFLETLYTMYKGIAG